MTEAHIRDEYRFLLSTLNGEFNRIAPYAREVTSSVGNAIVYDPRFDWQGDAFQLAPWNELVIYELHVGTFNDQDDLNHPWKFSSVAAKLKHLKKLGIKAIQIMPVNELAGERSWGTILSRSFRWSLPMVARLPLWHHGGKEKEITPDKVD